MNETMLDVSLACILVSVISDSAVRNTISETLPAGLQFLGRPYSEADLIQFAYAYEQGTLHRRPPAAFPELADGE